MFFLFAVIELLQKQVRGRVMHIVHKISGNTCTIYLAGELDEHTATYTRSALDEIVSALKYNMQVVLELSNLLFMDSTGIGVILGRYKKFDKRGISFAVKNPSLHIDKILRMTGIYSIIPNIA